MGPCGERRAKWRALDRSQFESLLKMKAKSIRPGAVVSFLYPRYNYLGLPVAVEPRRAKIMAVRDMKGQPLDPTTCQRNPTLRRGRYLVTAEDLDKGEERRFYFESMTEIRKIDAAVEYQRSRFIILNGSRKVFCSERLIDCIRWAVEKTGEIYGRMASEKS
jgi:hypothetical protein